MVLVEQVTEVLLTLQGLSVDETLSPGLASGYPRSYGVVYRRATASTASVNPNCWLGD